MKTGIKIRDALLAAGGEAFPDIPDKNRVSRKQEKVENWPFLSVYLEPMNSEVTAMRGGRERTQDVIIALFRKGETDLEDVFSNDLDHLENLIEKKRRNGDFGKNTSIWLTTSNMNFPPDSKNKFGSLNMIFSFSYPHQVGV